MPTLAPPPSPAAAAPRILIVSRRSIRKNKAVNFVGEYHLDLLVANGAVPLIVPLSAHLLPALLSAYAPIHGLLLCEGEDISPPFLPPAAPLPPAARLAIAAAHPSDIAHDPRKDRLEFALVRHCLARAIPLLAICRGAQLVNVVAGGALHPDLALCLPAAVPHIDYHNYDAHRHPVTLVPDTPLAAWFDRAPALDVNSYHHQGIASLAPRFAPMAHAPDGLVEAYYDPAHYDPHRGQFVVGLQFHPERMQDSDAALAGKRPAFDYPGCPRPYEAFVRAAAAYQARTEAHSRAIAAPVPRAIKKAPAADGRRSTKREDAMNAFDLASRLYHVDENKPASKPRDGVLSKGAAFLEATNPMATYTKEDLNRLIRSGASVHGTRLVHQLLQEKTNAMDTDDWSRASRKSGHVSHWKRFQDSVLQAERALESLRGTPHMKDAAALVHKLSELTGLLPFSDSKPIGFSSHELHGLSVNSS